MSIVDLFSEFIAIPAGPFLMGTPERELSALAKAYGGTRESYREESPEHIVMLPAFSIAKTPVTNAQYASFVAATGARPPIAWRGAQPPVARRGHPATDLSWEDASAFCGWLSEVRAKHSPNNGLFIDYPSLANASPLHFRLPTEAEWERAARGVDGRSFPWGNLWEASRANTRDGGAGGTTPVEAYPAGASPAGCLDMAGNVWEWTASLDIPYPYVPGGECEDPHAPGRRILRGGCYANPHGFARCACRFRLLPTVRNEFLGFRLACS